ncbi:MAG: InlB B-repeat-containing protein [Erysipelotrichaceae bacterium]|nr:InlB B-repeat-containing protein [Erysipelotrichaceae bacterium]
MLKNTLKIIFSFLTIIVMYSSLNIFAQESNTVSNITLDVNLNEGTSTNIPTTVNVSLNNNEYTISKNDLQFNPVRTGFEFAGWIVEAEVMLYEQGAPIFDMEGFIIGFETVAAGVEKIAISNNDFLEKDIKVHLSENKVLDKLILSAKWNKVEYVIAKFNLDGGFAPQDNLNIFEDYTTSIITDVNSEQLIETDEFKYLENIIPVKDGYVFKGWNVEQELELYVNQPIFDMEGGFVGYSKEFEKVESRLIYDNYNTSNIFTFKSNAMEVVKYIKFTAIWEKIEKIKIGKHLWNDLNKDGIYDGVEESGVGLTVQLFDTNNVKISETITDEQGNYEFIADKNSKYKLKFILPNDYEITTNFNNKAAQNLNIVEIDIDTKDADDYSYNIGYVKRENIPVKIEEKNKIEISVKPTPETTVTPKENIVVNPIQKQWKIPNTSSNNHIFAYILTIGISLFLTYKLKKQ